MSRTTCETAVCQDCDHDILLLHRYLLCASSVNKRLSFLFTDDAHSRYLRKSNMSWSQWSRDYHSSLSSCLVKVWIKTSETETQTHTQRGGGGGGLHYALFKKLKCPLI